MTCCFSLDFFVLFLWYFKTYLDINYLRIFMFYILDGKYKYVSGSRVQYVGNKQVMWKYTLFQPILITR